MLWVYTEPLEAKDSFYALFPDLTHIDLSKVPSSKLVEESDSLLQHQSKCAVFIGYLEPGFMLEPAHQTRLRKLFRTCPVGMSCVHLASFPFSWKNEIDTIYRVNPHGHANTLNNGGPIQDKPTH
jgi:hypothetical protein